jgi:hypothetical protein
MNINHLWTNENSVFKISFSVFNELMDNLESFTKEEILKRIRDKGGVPRFWSWVFPDEYFQQWIDHGILKFDPQMWEKWMYVWTEKCCQNLLETLK